MGAQSMNTDERVGDVVGATDWTRSREWCVPVIANVSVSVTVTISGRVFPLSLAYLYDSVFITSIFITNISVSI